MLYVGGAECLNSGYTVRYLHHHSPTGHLRYYDDDYDNNDGNFLPFSSGLLFVSRRDDSSYFATLTDKYVNFQSLCSDAPAADSTTTTTHPHRFLVYDSSKVRILYDSCMRELDDYYNSGGGDDDTDTTTIRRRPFYQHAVLGGIRYVDYSNNSEPNEDPTPPPPPLLTRCYGVGNYVLLIRLLKPKPTDFEAGESVFRLKCDDTHPILQTGDLPVLRSVARVYADHVHTQFVQFDRREGEGDSPGRYFARSAGPVRYITAASRPVLHYCYVDGSTKVPFILREQFGREGDYVTLSDLSPMVYLSYVAISEDSREVIHPLHCFFTL